MTHRWGGPVRSIVLLALLLATVTQSATTQEMPAPIDRQVSLLTRILQFDRAFQRHPPGDLVIAVLYQSLFRASVMAREAVTSALEAHGPVGGRQLRIIHVELDPDVPIECRLGSIGASVLYIAPLRAVGLGDIIAATKKYGILSVTGVPDYVEAGVSVGISVRGERPEILINLSSSLEEGARFSSEVLNLARIIETRRDPDA